MEDRTGDEIPEVVVTTAAGEELWGAAIAPGGLFPDRTADDDLLDLAGAFDLVILASRIKRSTWYSFTKPYPPCT